MRIHRRYDVSLNVDYSDLCHLTFKKQGRESAHSNLIKIA